MCVPLLINTLMIFLLSGIVYTS